MKRTTLIIEKIYLMILCSNIVLLNLLVGSSHTDPRFALQALIMFETLIYIIIQKINKKKNILIKSKIDICMILYTISSSLPLIFKTYASQNYTINMILMQLTVYCLYIQTRNIITTPKRKNILINTALISSILIVIFGIDELYFDTFRPFLNLIYSANSDAYGMVSTIGYSNAVASYMTFMLFLALGKYLSTQTNWQKSLYAVSMQISMLGIYFGNSRAGMVIFAMLIVPYLIKIKEIKARIQVIIQIIGTFLMAFIFQKVLNQYTNEWIIWIQFLALLLLNYIINYVYEIIEPKVQNKMKMKSYKKYIIDLGIVATIIFIIFALTIGKQSKPIVMGEKEKFIEILGEKLEPNTNYKITIEYEAKVNEKNDTIEIFEINKYRKQKEIGSTYIKNGTNIETIEIETTNMEIERARIYFYLYNNDKVTVNKIYINDKEYIARYKYIPDSIVRLIRTINLKTTSISERLTMYSDGLKLVKRSPLIGNGGKAFSSLYPTVKSYNYDTFELHSYIIDLLLDYGIFGLISYLVIIAITIKNFLDDKKTIMDLSIFTAIMFVTIHTMFDFDLSYMVTLANYFIFIAIYNEKDKNIENTKLDKFISNILCIILSVLIIFTSRCAYGRYILSKSDDYNTAAKYYPYCKKIKEKMINENPENNELIKKYLKTEKYTLQAQMCRRIYNNIKKEYEKDKDYNAKEDLEFLYDELVKNERIERYEVGKILNQGKLLNSIILLIEEINQEKQDEELNKMIDGYVQKFMSEYNENVMQIKESDKNFASESEIQRQLKQYSEIYTEMNKRINRY